LVETGSNGGKLAQTGRMGGQQTQDLKFGGNGIFPIPPKNSRRKASPISASELPFIWIVLSVLLEQLSSSSNTLS